jgi:hypothetical protein
MRSSWPPLDGSLPAINRHRQPTESRYQTSSRPLGEPTQGLRKRPRFPGPAQQLRGASGLMEGLYSL